MIMILDAARQAYIKTKLPNRNMRYHMDSKPTGYGSPHRKTPMYDLGPVLASVRTSSSCGKHQSQLSSKRAPDLEQDQERLPDSQLLSTDLEWVAALLLS